MAVTGRYTYRLGTQAEIVESYVPFGIPLRERFVAQAFQQVCMGLWPMCPRHPRSHTIHPKLLSHTFSHSSPRVTFTHILTQFECASRQDGRQRASANG
jgi:hypothetical protein